jgi:hypothetical protein
LAFYRSVFLAFLSVTFLDLHLCSELAIHFATFFKNKFYSYIYLSITCPVYVLFRINGANIKSFEMFKARYHQVQSLLYSVKLCVRIRAKIKQRFVVQVSFDLAEYTAEVDGVGTLRLLDAIRTCGLSDSVRFYQVL